MKTLLSFLLSICFLFAGAQGVEVPEAPEVDSSAVLITVALPAEQHYLIIDFFPEVKSPRIANYIKQVVNQTDSIYNPQKLISVTSESGLVPEVYELLSIQREGVTAQPNEDMKAALLPWLPEYSWITTEIRRIDEKNRLIREQRTQRGYEYCRNLKF